MSRCRSARSQLAQRLTSSRRSRRATEPSRQRPRHSTGDISRCSTRPRPAFSTRYTTRPLRRTPKREREGRTREAAAQSLACETIVGGDMDAGVQVEALVHRGVGDARGRLGKPVLGARAGVLRRLEGAPLHPCEGHGLARAVRRRLVRGGLRVRAPRYRGMPAMTRTTKGFVMPRPVAVTCRTPGACTSVS